MNKYHWVINETTTTIKDICKQANVRFKIGKHKDGDPYSKGMYVHYDDLSKLKKWFKSTGQRAKADWTQEAKDEAKKWDSNN